MNNLNTLSSNEDIKNKIIFLRVDFNIPIKDGEVIDDTKIVKMKDIINKLLSKKTKIIMHVSFLAGISYKDTVYLSDNQYFIKKGCHIR
jgi:3-phosphoglycerate kinase